MEMHRMRTRNMQKGRMGSSITSSNPRKNKPEDTKTSRAANHTGKEYRRSDETGIRKLLKYGRGNRGTLGKTSPKHA